MTEYTISVFPNGLNKSSVVLVFRDQDDKTEYIRQEAIYCRREQSLYLGELFNNDNRKTKKDNFHKKRVEFAQKQHFKPVSRTRWERKYDEPSHGNDPLGVA